MINKQALSLLDRHTDGWLSEAIGQVNSNCVNARVMHDFESKFHVHAESDEFFLVIAGHLEIDLESQTIHLEKGDAFTVEAGLNHRARAVGRVELITIIGRPQ